MNLKVKITKCSNNILWYSRFVGQEFEVVKQEANSFWVLEPNEQFRLINWISKEDVEIVKDTNETK